MLEDELKVFYHRTLVSNEAPFKMKMEVLINIEMYLNEEEKRMIQHDLECKNVNSCESFHFILNKYYYFRVEKFEEGKFEGNG